MPTLPNALAALALVTGAVAQSAESRPTSQPDAPAAPTAQEALQTLEKACGKMSHLQGLHFSSSQEEENALTRQLGGMLGGGGADSTDVIGRWTPTTVELEIGDADDVVVHGTRMIARDDHHDWSLRRDCLADGGDMPFMFDPGLFFETLGDAIGGNLEFTRAEFVTRGERRYLQVSVTVQDDLAREFAFSGALPRASQSGGIVMLGGVRGLDMPKPSVTTDLAIQIDPESHLIDRIRVKTYEDSPFGGNVVFQVQGADQDDEEEPEEVRTVDENGQRIFEQGLPIRAVEDSQSVLTFSVRFKDHDKPMLPDLDDRARGLLRIR
ncbi:MAG: hypothetical protein KDB80_03530 [Planctomycetes bacterium]|nr:hypothetical protein [Planctomycetota bacterium]